MKSYFLLLLISLLLGNLNSQNNVNHIYVDSNILSSGFEMVDISETVDIAEEKIDSDTVVGEVLEVQVGKLSRYGPDCYGCSGYLAYGDYVGDGTIFYTDSEYGDVKILAADRKYPFGTIVRVNTGSESFIAIVLDRGGAIGFGKVALFDLLYPSEYLANLDGVSYNTTFEILRYGF